MAKHLDGNALGVVHSSQERAPLATLVARAKVEARKRRDVVAFAANPGWGIQYYGRAAFPFISASGWTSYTLATPAVEALLHPFGLGKSFAPSVPASCSEKVLFIRGPTYGQMNNNLLSIRAAWAVASRVGRSVVLETLVRGGRLRYYYNVSRHCIVDSDEWVPPRTEAPLDITKSTIGGDSAPASYSHAVAVLSAAKIASRAVVTITFEQLYYMCITPELKREWYASVLAPSDELAKEVLRFQNAHLGGPGAYTALHWRADGGGFDCTRRATEYYSPTLRPAVQATCKMDLATIDDIVRVRGTAGLPFFLATNRADFSQFAKYKPQRYAGARKGRGDWAAVVDMMLLRGSKVQIGHAPSTFDYNVAMLRDAAGVPRADSITAWPAVATLPGGRSSALECPAVSFWCNGMGRAVGTGNRGMSPC